MIQEYNKNNLEIWSLNELGIDPVKVNINNHIYDINELKELYNTIGKLIENKFSFDIGDRARFITDTTDFGEVTIVSLQSSRATVKLDFPFELDGRKIHSCEVHINFIRKIDDA